MTDTIITVQGEHSTWLPAERATVHTSVRVDGPRRDAVFASAVKASDAVRTSIEALFDKDGGPVTWWSSDSVRVWSERPWNNDGKQLALVYHSAVDFTAKFMDFDALSRWVEMAAGLDSVTVGSINWDLTDETRKKANTEVRSLAVADAVAKATIFATSIGLTTVTAVALADPGMLGDPTGGSGGGMAAPTFRGAMKAASFDSQGGPQLTLKPEDIAVASVVDARFVAN